MRRTVVGDWLRETVRSDDGRYERHSLRPLSFVGATEWDLEPGVGRHRTAEMTDRSECEQMKSREDRNGIAGESEQNGIPLRGERREDGRQWLGLLQVERSFFL